MNDIVREIASYLLLKEVLVMRLVSKAFHVDISHIEVEYDDNRIKTWNTNKKGLITYFGINDPEARQKPIDALLVYIDEDQKTFDSYNKIKTVVVSPSCEYLLLKGTYCINYKTSLKNMVYTHSLNNESICTNCNKKLIFEPFIMDPSIGNIPFFLYQ